jgi:single-stranded-DNA-specific exonuclease
MPLATRGLTARWTLPDAAATTEGSLIDRTLIARGLDTAEARNEFLQARFNDLPDPDTLPGCTAAATRILEALHDGTPITIYGDFDVDGITATSILWHTFRAIEPAADVEWYIPHRLDEGYGLNAQALTTLAENGRKLIVTVDCGVTAIEETQHAASIGLELIITDHHTLHEGDPLPEATAIVHPALPHDPYSFPSLAGAGVAWKLALLTARLHEKADKLGPALKGVLMDALSLAAMGTVADVMPLIGENRSIVRVGLWHMAECKNHGIQALLKACIKHGEHVDAEAVGYRIGPRLNAAGRLGHAAEAVELLTSAKGDRATELAKSLTKQNEVRQKRVRSLLEIVDQAAQDAGMTGPDKRIIVLDGDTDQWHRGVLGIACSRLVETYQRPVILLRQDGDILGGSCRSVPGVSMYDALSHCTDLLDKWGGHHMAAGLSLKPENLEAFVERITQWVNERITEGELLAEVIVDCTATSGDLTLASIQALESLRPMGRGNERPCVVVRDAVVRQPKVFGKNSDHLGFTLDMDDKNIDTVWWRGAEHAEHLAEGVRVDVVAKPIIDTWRQRRPRLVIEDVAILPG